MDDLALKSSIIALLEALTRLVDTAQKGLAEEIRRTQSPNPHDHKPGIN